MATGLLVITDKALILQWAGDPNIKGPPCWPMTLTANLLGKTLKEQNAGFHMHASHCVVSLPLEAEGVPTAPELSVYPVSPQPKIRSGDPQSWGKQSHPPCFLPKWIQSNSDTARKQS